MDPVNSYSFTNVLLQHRRLIIHDFHSEKIPQLLFLLWEHLRISFKSIFNLKKSVKVKWIEFLNVVMFCTVLLTVFIQTRHLVGWKRIRTTGKTCLGLLQGLNLGSHQTYIGSQLGSKSTVILPSISYPLPFMTNLIIYEKNLKSYRQQIQLFQTQPLPGITLDKIKFQDR